MRTIEDCGGGCSVADGLLPNFISFYLSFMSSWVMALYHEVMLLGFCLVITIPTRLWGEPPPPRLPCMSGMTITISLQCFRWLRMHASLITYCFTILLDACDIDIDIDGRIVTW
jgi:hypothetical protein